MQSCLRTKMIGSMTVCIGKNTEQLRSSTMMCSYLKRVTAIKLY